MPEAVVHRLLDKASDVQVDKAGVPYFATACGVRVNDKPVVITSIAGDVTCAKCKATAKRGSRR